MFIDSHCHIHEKDYPLLIQDVIERAVSAGVSKMVCVGTSLDSSKRAIEVSKQYPQIYASIGVHPHDSEDGFEIDHLLDDANPKIKAIGEIGLDYFYTLSPKTDQIKALEHQLDLAIKRNLSVIFHVRDAFDDFWPIFDNFSSNSGKIRAVIHSFSDSTTNLEKALTRGLYIGVNGIATFTKDSSQKDMYGSIPLNSLVLETDSPFLTPAPIRGTINEPANIKHVALFLADQRRIGIDEVASITSNNAKRLFDFES